MGKRGELSRGPIPEYDGHLLVIRGFDPSGDVIVNYPAGRDGSRVRRVHRRGECVRAWLCFGSDGVAYLVYQEGSASNRAVDDVRGSN